MKKGLGQGDQPVAPILSLTAIADRGVKSTHRDQERVRVAADEADYIATGNGVRLYNLQ